MPATYEPIATTTLGSSSSTITFSSISSGYTDLKLVLVGTASTSANARIRFNSDTASNYSLTVLAGDGSSVYSAKAINQTFLDLMYSSYFTAAIPTMVVADIFSYTNSKNKTILISRAAQFSGGYVENLAGLWRNTATINRIDLSLQTGTFSTGTMATLYGILKA
jgi:hypothetical protein